MVHVQRARFLLSQIVSGMALGTSVAAGWWCSGKHGAVHGAVSLTRHGGFPFLVPDLILSMFLFLLPPLFNNRTLGGCKGSHQMVPPEAYGCVAITQ